MNPSSAKRRTAKAQHREKLLRRKTRQLRQKQFEKELIRMRRAETALTVSLIVLLLLSFLLFADRACGGALSVLMMLLLIFHLVILRRFKTLWKKLFIPLLCTYAVSSAILAVFCTAQSAVFTPFAPMPWVLSIWALLLAGWLRVILKQSERRKQSAAASLLIALSLFSFSFFWADRVNISFDRSHAQSITADVLHCEKKWSESSYTYWIKAAFPLKNETRTTHRFCILRTDDYELLSSQNEITLLCHEGALGCEWYEIDLPK